MVKIRTTLSTCKRIIIRFHAGINDIQVPKILLGLCISISKNHSCSVVAYLVFVAFSGLMINKQAERDKHGHRPPNESDSRTRTPNVKYSFSTWIFKTVRHVYIPAPFQFRNFAAFIFIFFIILFTIRIWNSRGLCLFFAELSRCGFDWQFWLLSPVCVCSI